MQVFGVQLNNKHQPSSSDTTHCQQAAFFFQDCASKKLAVSFDGGSLSSDGGLPLLRQLDSSLGLSRQLASCFTDRRDQNRIVHSSGQLVSQRLLAIAHGYEDLNDHAQLRLDPLFQVAAGKFDLPAGLRPDGSDAGLALASAPTLNRLELSSQRESLYHKIHVKPASVQDLLIKFGSRTLRKSRRVIILDFDATHDPLHGRQEGRFFHGYYDCHCYLPLFAFVGDTPFWSQLRTSDRDGCDGTVEALEKIVSALRKRCPKARIIVRADSGFCRDAILSWCEARKIDYVIGLARNERLLAKLEPAMIRARERACLVGGATREYCEFEYRTQDSWSRARRVIGKAERLCNKDNPRFIVTTLETDAQKLYEQTYCARGDMENRIKEQQLEMFAKRMSSGSFAANQLRLWMSVFAYSLLERLRAVALKGGELAKASVGTIRLNLLKQAARVEVSVRRISVRLSGRSAMRRVYEQAWRRLMALGLPSG
jgi:hypothetical protein